MVTVVEVNNEQEEILAFQNGALIVIRLDLIPEVVVPIESNIKVMLDFNDFTDSSVYGNTVLLNSSPSVSNGVLDYQDGYLRIQDNPELRFNTEDWEIEVMHKVKSTDSNTHDFLCSKGVNGDINNGWYLGILIGGKICFSNANNNTPIYETYPYANDTTNFHKITLKRVSDKLKLFVDDVLFKEVNYVNVYDGLGALHIGAWHYTRANTKGSFLDSFKLTIGL